MCKDVDFEKLRSVKFNVISHFGIVKHKSEREFFIMDVIPPIEYGADCKDYTWYYLALKTDEDYKSLKQFIEDVFQIHCPDLTKENSIKTVELIEKELEKKAKIEDWGACHVTHLPYAEQFRKVGE